MSPPKYPRTFHLPFSAGVQSDDKINHDISSFLNSPITITEKLDGGCTILNNGEVYSRSSGTPATESWFGMVRKHHSWKTTSLGKDVSVYGEDLFGIHSIDYGAFNESETFRVFNLLINDNFLSYEERIKFCVKYNFLHVPVVFEGVISSAEELEKLINRLISEPSLIGSETAPREGFVIQRKNAFHIDEFNKNVIKYVRKNHVQTGSDWRRIWKQCSLK